MPAAATDVRALLLLPLLLGGGAAAQDEPATAPTVRVAIGAAASRSRLPALAELCERHLPHHVGALPDSGFGLEAKDGTWRQFAADIVLPPDIVVAGSCRFGDGPPLLWSTATDGTEDWFVPPGFTVPPAWRALLATAHADRLDTPTTLATAVVMAHLAGPSTEGDPHAELLRLVAGACGDVTWIAWRNGPALRVRGRSDGGLALPAALALLANTEPRAFAPQTLRAFASRDAQRGEAARQLLRGDAPRSIPVLRALLHADDDTALAAIDALVRLCATEELPRIVAAAGPGRPAATLAAVQAMHELWPAATAPVRQRTRGALARSQSIELRGLDLAALAGEAPAVLPPEPTLDGRGRALVWLALTAFGLCGCWLRERHRSSLAPA